MVRNQPDPPIQSPQSRVLIFEFLYLHKQIQDWREASKTRRNQRRVLRYARKITTTYCAAYRRSMGGLAQLGEHLLCKQGVVGSIPSSSTINICCQSLALIITQHQSNFARGCFVVDIPCGHRRGCSLTIHRVEISVVRGNCAFVKV